MKIQIVKHYATTDIMFSGECVVDLIVNGEFIYVAQDHYHNGVDSKIEGFIDCLKNMKVSYELIITKLSDCELLDD